MLFGSCSASGDTDDPLLEAVLPWQEPDRTVNRIASGPSSLDQNQLLTYKFSPQTPQLPSQGRRSLGPKLPHHTSQAGHRARTRANLRCLLPPRLHIAATLALPHLNTAGLVPGRLLGVVTWGPGIHGTFWDQAEAELVTRLKPDNIQRGGPQSLLLGWGQRVWPMFQGWLSPSAMMPHPCPLSFADFRPFAHITSPRMA